jgi:hypothetical protein
MKKLLLVLVVVAMASFLLVGCLPGGTTPPPDDDDDDDDVVVAAITVEGEYTNLGGVTFVACKNADDYPSVITVTLPTAVEVDYAVVVAVKEYNESTELYEYSSERYATPNADRTVWTVDDFPWSESACEPICIVAMVKHPCCPGEEVALRILTVDCTPPVFNLYAKFTDCEEECPAEPGPCDPEPFAGVSMEWTSRAGDACETVDCCEDTCSGANAWSMVIDADPCAASCDEASGTGCPIEGVFECECFAYADSGETATYDIDFSFEDNVGNAVTGTWVLTLDTDSVVSFGGLTPDTAGWYQLFNLLPDCPEEIDG